MAAQQVSRYSHVLPDGLNSWVSPQFLTAPSMQRRKGYALSRAFLKDLVYLWQWFRLAIEALN